jgi:outer membrane protein assembly factor BamB
MRSLRALAVAALALPLLLPTSPARAQSPTDWFGYHGNALHDGYAPGSPPASTPKVAWTKPLDGKVYAAPLVIGDVVIAATENNSVFALSRTTGQQVWGHHYGTPVRLSSLPCGNVDPLGITGTPVVDPASRRVFFVTVTSVGGHLRHTLLGVNWQSGRTEVSVVIDPRGQDPDVENQRGALALSRGRVLITYGGHSGDCGSFYGWLISVPTSGQGVGYARIGTRGEAGLWQPSGPSVDGSGFAYVVSGNGRATSGAWDGGNSVQVFDPVSLQRRDYFAEASWAQGNRDDSDLGSSGALLFQGRIWIQGKTSTGYVLDLHHLGGIGHPVQAVHNACDRQFGGAATHRDSLFLPCTDGIRQLVVLSNRTVRLGWKARSTIIGSPVVAGGAVWALDPAAGVLYELSERSGAVVHTVKVGATSRFATPAVSGSLLFVNTSAGITAVNGV